MNTHRRTAQAALVLCCAVLGTAAALAQPANLLANPGFEEGAADRAVAWNTFLMPQPGAAARRDSDAHAGAASAMLHTPTPYPEEPLNNWSQNVNGEFAGKRIEAAAWIKTRDAGEAALWVQCWRRQPRALLHTANSSTVDPVYGTMPWRQVRLNFTAPAGTDALTVRCVLLGTGTAWFDDLELRIAETPPPNTAPAAAASPSPATPAATNPAPPSPSPSTETRSTTPTATAPTAPTPPTVPEVPRPVPPVAPEAQPAPAAGQTLAAATPPVAALPQTLAITEQLLQQITALRNANADLNAAIASLESANRSLREEINSLRTELEALRPAAPASTPPAAQPAPMNPAPPPRSVPPLVPRGFDLDSLE